MAAARRNVDAAASCGAALPSPPRDTASASTAAAPVLVAAAAAWSAAAAVADSVPSLANQSRSMAASSHEITVTASVIIFVPRFENRKIRKINKNSKQGKR